MKLTNETVELELKNGTVVQGVIVSVSPNMNVSLKKVKMTIKNRDPQVVDFINVRGNNIRNVIMRDSVNLDLLLKETANIIKRQDNSGKKRKLDSVNDSNKRVKRAL